MLLVEQGHAGTPTDADYHDVYQRWWARASCPSRHRAIRSSRSCSSRSSESIGAGVALRNALTAAMKRYDASVNPKYLPVGFPVEYINVR